MSRSESTLHDVAARVGVSTRTVSRVVNGEGGFSTATGARVKAAIDELGYRPNLLARSLITKRSMTIGLVGGSMTDPFFPELAEGVHEAASTVGLTTLFAATDDSVDRQHQVVESLRSRAVDGIILFPAGGLIEPIRILADDGLNVVAINPAETSVAVSSISSDITGGARTAIAHLRSRGRRRIAFLGSDSPYSTRREAGYREAAADDEPLVAKANPTADGGMIGAQEILDRWPRVDAIFAYNDLMAMAALRVLEAAGRSVPDDVAVVGFDNIGLSAHLKPPLTTVDLDQRNLGRLAVELLAEAIDTPERISRQVTHPARLVIRASS